MKSGIKILACVSVLLASSFVLTGCSSVYSSHNYVVKKARGAAINSIQRYERTSGIPVTYQAGSIFENIYHLGNPINVFGQNKDFWFFLSSDKVVSARLSDNLLFRRVKEIDVSNYGYVDGIQLENGNLALISEEKVDNNTKRLNIHIWDISNNTLIREIKSTQNIPQKTRFSIIPLFDGGFLLIPAPYNPKKSYSASDVVQPIERYYFSKDEIKVISDEVILRSSSNTRYGAIQSENGNVLIYGSDIKHQMPIFIALNNTFRKVPMPRTIDTTTQKRLEKSYTGILGVLDKDLFYIHSDGKHSAKTVYVCKFDGIKIDVVKKIEIPQKQYTEKTFSMPLDKNSILIVNTNDIKAKENKRHILSEGYILNIDSNKITKFRPQSLRLDSANQDLRTTKVSGNMVLVYDKYINSKRGRFMPGMNIKEQFYYLLAPEFGKFIKH